MRRVFVFEAIRFGFTSLKEKFLFFLGAYVVTALAAIAGVFVMSIAVTPIFLGFAATIISVKAEFLALLGKVGTQAGIWSQPIGPDGIFQAQMSPDVTFAQIKMFVVDFAKAMLLFLWGHPEIWILLFVGIMLASLLSLGLYYYFYAGWARISLDIYDKGSSSISSLFSRFSVFIKLMVAAFFYSFIALMPWKLAVLFSLLYPAIGLIILWVVLAAVSSIFFLLKFVYFPFFIVDKNAGIFESLGSAFRLKGAAWRVLLLALLYGSINSLFGRLVFSYFPPILYVLCTFAFYFVTWIILYMALGFLYRKLSAA